MAESNADKNAETTSSPPVASDETIKNLDVRVSDTEMNDVKGGAASEKPNENISFNFGTFTPTYHNR